MCVFKICSWYLVRLWVQSVLDITLSHNAKVSDDFDGRVPQHVVFMVVKRLTGRHYDGFSGMDAQRVNILHITHLNKENKSSLTHTVKYLKISVIIVTKLVF